MGASAGEHPIAQKILRATGGARASTTPAIDSR